MSAPHRIIVIDDDREMRRSLEHLLSSAGGEVELLSRGEQLADRQAHVDPDVILTDVRMPGISGLDILKAQEDPLSPPIVLISAHGDIPMAVEAMHLGAHDFVQKPFHDQELLDRIQAALTARREIQDEIEKKKAAQENYGTLTPRETEVMSAVAKGHANKVIAMDLELSQRTVEIHRARVMEKMQARSLAELVKLAVLLEQ